jgi:hypothetical protein
MTVERKGQFNTEVIKQYYVAVFPISYKYKFTKSSVIKSVLGDVTILKRRKLVYYLSDLYKEESIWQFDKRCIDWKLKSQSYEGILSGSYRNAFDNIYEIRVFSRADYRLGYKYIVLEFCVSPSKNSTEVFSKIESDLDSMKTQFFNHLIQKRLGIRKDSKECPTFKFTYIATRTDLSMAEAYLEIRYGNQLLSSRLPKGISSHGYQEVLEKATPVERYLKSLLVSKRNAWLLDQDFTEKYGSYMVLAGSQEGGYGEKMNSCNIRLCGLFNKNIELTELHSPFNIFETNKGNERSYFIDKSYLESLFDSLLAINLDEATLSMGLLLEIKELHEQIDKISNSLTNYGKWSERKMLRLHSKILKLTIRAYEYKSRIQAFQTDISKKYPKQSKFEVKIPADPFPYFDIQDYALASLWWSPDEDLDFGYVKIEEVKPILKETFVPKGDNSLFTTQFIGHAKDDLNSASKEAERAIEKLTNMNKRFEPVVTAIHSKRLLWWTLVVSGATIALVILNLFQIFGRF